MFCLYAVNVYIHDLFYMHFSLIYTTSLDLNNASGIVKDYLSTKMDAANIRIDATLLQSHQGKLVRIIGKCENFDSNSSAGTLSSNGPVNLTFAGGDILVPGKNYEIIGKVSSNNVTVNVYSVIELSDNVNLEVAQKLVQFVHKVPELYYE